jgi:hypothetical protein
MSSGQSTIVINPQERAVSVDINRLQAFRGRDESEMLRYLLNVSAGTDDLDYTVAEYTTQDSPLKGEILNGLMVKPDVGTFSVTIDPGIVCFVDPGAVPSTDDSVYKKVKDPGITVAGTLNITAGAGSDRIDIIECALIAAPGYEVVETDNRDIFNSSTGTFSATTVNKVVRGRLQYRVRAGTPGAGWPGTAVGWMPLMVALVPTGATSNDTMTFWDVRPLLSDREHSLFNLSEDMPSFRRVLLNMEASMSLNGTFDVGFRGRRLGGRARRASPGTDADIIDFSLTANQQLGFTPTDGLGWHLYACTPFGLPRWARYTDFGTGSRRPRAPRGMMLLSHIAPGFTGRPATTIPLPAELGMGAGVVATTEALCVLSGRYDTGGPTFYGATACAGTVMPFGTLNGVNFTATLPANNFDYSFATTDGVEYPKNAKSLLLSLTSLWPGVVPQHSVSVKTNGGAVQGYTKLHQTLNTNGNHVDFELPLPPIYPSAIAVTRQIIFTYNSGSNPSSAALHLRGWKI